MRNLTIRDAIATLIAAAVVVPFVGYSIGGSMPFLQDPRGMAGVGIVGVVLLAITFGAAAFRAHRTGVILTVVGLVALGFGIAALIAGTSWTLLVPMAAGIVVLWILGLTEDAVGITRPTALRHG
jgi:hypothetical protein